MWPCIVTIFFNYKTNRRTNFSKFIFLRNSTCFGQFLCLSSGVFHLTFGTGICHARTMCPGVDSASENEYQGFLLAAGAYGWRPTALVVPNVKKIRGLNVPGTLWATSTCCGMTFNFMSCKTDDSFQSMSILDVPESCHQTCMTYTSAEFTVENSWWWAEELSETCSFLTKMNLEKLVLLFV